MESANTQETTTETDFAKSVQTPSKASGRSREAGFARTRGISREKLPLYLGFFEFARNERKRGKALLDSLIGLLVK